jgi:hypothetical protein
MSAFVVNRETISHAVFGLNLVGMPRPGSSTDLGQQLLTMNIEAVRQRYDDEAVAGEDASRYTYNKPAEVPGCSPEIAAWKALECLLYQCSEGDVPQRALYLEVEHYAKKLGEQILTKHPRVKSMWDLPEIQNAPWGF